ncbi:MAG: NAD(P)-binding domain-containing protein [Ilumatobacter sp.]|uniref:NADPH-dependent F420 reductase n=1 Tax=Ilumatobacter sp. TaxID=1967498 RepID=UPI002621AE35|nr:NAD(P)-binding domain-containing protein [Ilumatobacter sp.]MDJ0769585.1 NAD(P)-binding domain-containing protein [Ilumatobacter sp.]
MSALDIAVLGAGVVGTNLARRFAELGHAVTFGARDVASGKVLAALDAVEGASALPIADAVAAADIAVLAVPYGAIGDVLGAIGDPADTVLVDATNPVGESLPDGAASIVDIIHERHPSAQVVKAFNTIGAEAYLEPRTDAGAYFLPIAGPSGAAERVRDLAAAMGFDALVIGDVDAAPLLESHAQLWIHLAFRTGLGRGFGFVRV